MLLGAIYYREGKYAEAVSLLEQSVAELSSALRDNRLYLLPELWQTLHRLAETYDAYGRNADSENAYKRALALFGKYHYENTSDEKSMFASILEDYASLLRKMDRISEATKLESQAKKIRLASKEQWN